MMQVKLRYLPDHNIVATVSQQLSYRHMVEAKVELDGR